MDLTQLPPISAVLDGADHLLELLVGALEPLAGNGAAALAIVLSTLVLRAAMLPLGVAQLRAQLAQQRIAPRLVELRRRHSTSPERLQRATLQLYREERVSPFAALWPALLQLPIVSLVYALFTRTQVAGHANALLGHALLGAPLGHSIGALLAAGGATAVAPAALVLVLTTTALLTRAQTIRTMPPERRTRGGRMLASASLLVVPFAALAPLAAGLYLATSGAWALAERAVLRARLAPA